MRLNVWTSVLAATLAFAAVPAFSQVRPTAESRGIPLVVGAGFSNFNADFGADRRISGGTIWADWTIRHMPRRLYGLGIEATARDLSFGATGGLSNLRYDTAGGGLIYHYLRPRSFRPYVRAGAQYGSIDFPPYPSGYSHDTRALTAFGGGADFHAWSHVWVRADYEYQVWQPMFGHTTHLTPQGFTVGTQWDFGRQEER
jgi:opacity protein-like surface antigen